MHFFIIAGVIILPPAIIPPCAVPFAEGIAIVLIGDGLAASAGVAADEAGAVVGVPGW